MLNHFFRQKVVTVVVAVMVTCRTLPRAVLIVSIQTCADFVEVEDTGLGSVQTAMQNLQRKRKLKLMHV